MTSYVAKLIQIMAAPTWADEEAAFPVMGLLDPPEGEDESCELNEKDSGHESGVFLDKETDEETEESSASPPSTEESDVSSSDSDDENDEYYVVTEQLEQGVPSPIFEDEEAAFPTMDLPDPPEREEESCELNEKDLTHENGVLLEKETEQSDISTSASDDENDDFAVTRAKLGKEQQESNNNNFVVKSHDSFTVNFHSIGDITQGEQRKQKQSLQEQVLEKSQEFPTVQPKEVPHIDLTRGEQQEGQNTQEQQSGKLRELSVTESTEVPRTSTEGPDVDENGGFFTRKSFDESVTENDNELNAYEPSLASRTSSTTFFWVNIFNLRP